VPVDDAVAVFGVDEDETFEAGAQPRTAHARKRN
jgi:hypothetical protein